ncbi:MAG: undecaprenyl-diphosphatase UppP [Candidatus Eremiobacteraeota bacterium]|nr:undecaprenyl-diphosphatase UppP [Candidatus Eremiobacteraeota bacterium]
MTELIHAAILGLTQGLAEFLPISSSAHLLIIPQIFGWSYLGKSFDVALHFGTLLALVAVFREDIAALLRGTRALLPGQAAKPEETRLVKLLVVGCLPAGIIGLTFEKAIEQKLGGLLFMAAMLIVWGVLLELADRKGADHRRTIADLTFKDALIIGCAQAAALMPGTSRSGSTITVALFLGFSRTEAARFSFLLSLPVVAGASLLKGIELATDASTLNILGPLLVGVLVSAVSGFLCIKYFLKYLQSNSFRPFVIYRIALGAFLIYWATTHGG